MREGEGDLLVQRAAAIAIKLTKESIDRRRFRLQTELEALLSEFLLVDLPLR